MEKSDVHAIPDFGRIASLFEQRLDGLVNRHSIDAVFDFTQRQFLPILHRLPKFALGLAGLSANNGSGHVAPITGLRVAWKNIENDQRVRVKQTVSTFVWIARLITTGDDRVGGES